MTTRRGKETVKVTFMTVLGGTAGYATVEAFGMSAAGIMGSGAGFGSAAGPVGAAAGALLGLAFYGVYRLFRG